MRKEAEGWVDKGIYPRQFREIILTKSHWDKTDLKRLFGTDEITVLAIMYSLGYDKINRSEFKKSDTNEAIESRKRWNE